MDWQLFFSIFGFSMMIGLFTLMGISYYLYISSHENVARYFTFTTISGMVCSIIVALILVLLG